MAGSIPIVCQTVSTFVFQVTREDGARLLLLKRADEHLRGDWCQVAGGIEAGEIGWHAALRILDDEVGIAPETFYSTDLVEQFYVPSTDRLELVPIFVAFVAPDPKVLLGEDYCDFCWSDLALAESLMPFVAQRDALREIWRLFINDTPSDHHRLPTEQPVDVGSLLDV